MVSRGLLDGANEAGLVAVMLAMASNAVRFLRYVSRLRYPSKRLMQDSDSYFMCSVVSDVSALATVYAIRYQVYCLERGLLGADSYPDGLEFDPFDAHSVHLLATHRCGHPAGAARLVMPSGLGFPLMQHCVFAGRFEALNDPQHPALGSFAEISRLAISKVFRRRASDGLYGGPPRRYEAPCCPMPAHPQWRPANSPEILMALSRSLYQESKRRGVTNWMVAMDRGLDVMLRRLGFRFDPAGPEGDYFGPVRPYVTSIKQFERRLHAISPPTLAYLAQGLEPSLWPHGLATEPGMRGPGR